MKKSKKLVTTDDLAIIVAKGFDDVKKEFKTELNSFKGETENNFKKVRNDLDSFKVETEDNFRKVRNDILNVGDRFVPRHEFDSFLTRFHRLEQKVDAKIAK